MTEEELRDQLAMTLIEHRLKQNLSHRDMHKRSGVNESVLSLIEGRQRSCSFATLVKIGNALGKRVVISFR